MELTRRELLAACAAVPALTPLFSAEPERTGMGVVIHSYPIRSADKQAHFDDPITFLEHCHQVGAGGIQTSLGSKDDVYIEKLRKRAEAWGMYLEGSVRLPRDQEDVERFVAEVRTAKACGAEVVRTVMLSGRRYEVFTTAEQFREFLTRARQSLALAKPIVEKQGVRLAVENHKDLEAKALAELIKAINSPHVGVCVDTGNNIALLEDPAETVEVLAPFAFTSHVKDMGVEEYADGFLLAEVPLGTGFLDLSRVIAVLRKAQPAIRFNLEMITRDPLKIPCLTDKYWATLGELPARRLAAMLALVRKHAAKQPLPRVSGLKREEQLRREDDNVRQSLRYAREKLQI
jgi:sugar phosphate isomerase/epimerase